MLLTGMAVAAVWASVSLPAWRFQVQREKELELIFRGEQYARAVMLYYVKNNRTLPSEVDQLVQGKYLRKKWKDPITGKDFALVLSGGGQVPPGGGGPAAPGSGSPAAPGRGGPTGGGQQPGRSGQPGQPSQGQPQQGGGLQGSGVAGVASASEAASIVVYQNVQQHSLWQFTLQAACQKYQINCFGQQNQGPGRGGDRGGGPGRGGDARPVLGAPGGRPGGGGPGRGGDAPPGRGGGPGRGRG